MTYPLQNPRASSIFGSQSAVDLQSPSVATTSSRFSVAPTTSQQRIGPGSTIYDRSLNKSRTAEVSASAFAFLFSEMIQYTQKRVSGIGDLERRYVAVHPATLELTENHLPNITDWEL